MNTQKRLYKGKDVEMLTVISTLVENAIANKTILQAKRSVWADPFFDDLKTQIDDTIQNFLGVDSAKELRQATQLVLGIQAGALGLLGDLKVQVETDFGDKTRRTEILKQLGFPVLYKKAYARDQEALVELLFYCKTNLIPALQTEITDKGTDPAIITGILAFADQLKNSNISQESFKQTRKVVSAEGVAAFNDVFAEAMKIAKIAARLFKDDPATTDQYSYRKLLAALNFHAAATPAQESAAPQKAAA